MAGVFQDPTKAPPGSCMDMSPQDMAETFVEVYYLRLRHSPQQINDFYKDISELVRPVEYGSMTVTNTLDAIKAKITSLRYRDLEVDIQYVDVQESLNGGIQVLVTGYLTGKDNVSHAFSQSLFLALQVKGGYFILNDMFRYMDNDTNTNYYHEGDQAPRNVCMHENSNPEQMVVPEVADKLQDSLQAGKAFVQHYYATLHQSPEHVYKFYKDLSKLGRPKENGSLCVTTNIDAIKAKILSLNYDDFTSEIKHIDAQVSLNGSISILVTGHLTGKNNVMKSFAQSFFLAPQYKGGYFVLNDMFRYIENNTSFHTEAVEAAARDYEKQYCVLFQ